MRAVLRLLAFVLAVWAIPASAGTPESAGRAATCHANAETAAEAAALRSGGPGWICENLGWSARTTFALLRFDLGANGRVPAQFATRLARFDKVVAFIERPDGAVVEAGIPDNAFFPQGNTRQAVDLPLAGQPARRLIVEFVRPTAAALSSAARVHAVSAAPIGPEQLWIAALCGVLLVPLFFNIALYRALRDQFLLWHVAVVAFMMLHTVASSGFASLVGRIPIGSLALLIPVSFSAGISCAFMLASEFIERDRIDPRLRRALRFTAAGLLINTAFFVITMDWLLQTALQIYLGVWLAAVALMCVALGNSLARGSRSAKFLAFSWLPMIVVGLWQIGESLTGDGAEPTVMFVLQRIAIAAEVLITSIAIADRFIQLRRDRDVNRVLVSEMTRLAERDPLTGLLNRRAIDARFAALRADGFATLALLDLDHFKAVNDGFGHAIGDDVLRAVARALPEDDNALAVRMGGEEFLLLLRGADAAQRAEQVRQSLTTRVAREVPGLNRPIAASMGLVEIPAEVMPQATFAAIYARADGLLYQAKNCGRNRTVREKLTAFGRTPVAPRSAA